MKNLPVNIFVSFMSVSVSDLIVYSADKSHCIILRNAANTLIIYYYS